MFACVCVRVNCTFLGRLLSAFFGFEFVSHGVSCFVNGVPCSFFNVAAVLLSEVG